MIDKHYKKMMEDDIFSLDHEVADDYREYWKTITPNDHTEYYKRWLFSFLSIQSHWKANSRSYVDLVNSEWSKQLPLFQRNALLEVLTESGIGLYNQRTEGIYMFHQLFWSDPDQFYKKEKETWVQFRERLNVMLKWIGRAKTSFALEMGFPEECKVVCLDRHIFRMYGISKNNGSRKKYFAVEDHFEGATREYGIPAPIARHMLWDRIQKKSSTKYWSYVFEEAESEEEE
jgi:thermostable 8-oxoguanine DNA glycosylase